MSFRFTRAIVRIPGPNFAEGLTTVRLGKPDYQKLLIQHQYYVRALENAGLQVEVLEPLIQYPDAYFVEDTAVICPHFAVLCRPGAIERRGEEQFIVQILRRFRSLHRIEAPGTVDGGDVLLVGRHFYIGLSTRTNMNGAEQFRKIAKDYHYRCDFVPVGAGLHLKSGVNAVAEDTLLLTESFTDIAAFQNYHRIIIPESESCAANSLRINSHLLIPEGFPQTAAQLDVLNLSMIALDVTEPRKMDGGLSCMSLRF